MRLELSGILEHVDRIQALDLDDVPPTTHVVEQRERAARRRAAPEPAGRGGAARGPRGRRGPLRGREVRCEPGASRAHRRGGRAGAARRPGQLARAGRRRPRARGGRPLGQRSSPSTPSARGPGPARSTRCPSGRPLGGLPIAIKDALSTRDLTTTAGLADPGGLPAALHRHLRRAARARRGGGDRQDQHGRVRHGVEHGELRLPGDPQPLGPRARARRLERRLGRRGGGLPGALVARQRHRRLDPPAGRPLRHRRAEAHLRRGLALRPDRLRVVARPGRPVRAHGARRGAAAVPPRRARPDGLDLPRMARARSRIPEAHATCAGCAWASWTS